MIPSGGFFVGQQRPRSCETAPSKRAKALGLTLPLALIDRAEKTKLAEASATLCHDGKD
jgi:hypothetical protein